MKRKQLNYVILDSTENEAREKATNWFSHLPNLSVDSVTPYKNDGYQVWISYDEEAPK